MRTTGCTLLAIAALGLHASAADATPGLATGFLDPTSFQQDDQAGRLATLNQARSVGASVIRLQLLWSSLEPVRPPDPATARDPAWAGYDWAHTDAVLRDVAAAGLTALVSFQSAPGWAEGTPRPSVSDDAPAGTWKPSPSDYGVFAEAAARRYSGTFPDPLAPGAMLPRVRFWEAWNEPNLSTYLSPQWGRSAPASPGLYRRLLNAFYAGVHAVDPTNRVVGLGLAPYGDPQPGGLRIMPVRFARDLLCLRGRALAMRPCPDPPRFDIVSHNPYSVGGPRRAALNEDDVSVPDIHKLTRVVRKARGAGRLLPDAPKPVWITEMSWDSRPPDPNGVPAAEHARWLEEGFYVLWRQGVSVVTWLLLRDSPPVPSFATTYQSGPFLLDGTPKPAARAFRFPFVSERRHDGSVRAWGRAPRPGVVVIERRDRRGRWVTVRQVTAGPSLVFTARLRLSLPARMRARQDADTSLTWAQMERAVSTGR